MKVVIPGSEIITKEQLHTILKRELKLSDYYGQNLDALFDCLTGWVDLPLTIEWKDFLESKKTLGEYADKAKETFQEAEEELEELTVIFK